jgi:hypothetical protein
VKQLAVYLNEECAIEQIERVEAKRLEAAREAFLRS